MIYSIRSKLLEIEIPSIETRKLVLQLLKKKNLSPSLCVYKYKKKKKKNRIIGEKEMRKLAMQFLWKY